MSFVFLRFKNALRSFTSLDPPIRLYICEGFLLAIITNFLNNNYNLFANRLGADDFQLGLVSLLPQLVNLIVLVPGGILADSLKNKSKMVLASIGASGILYLIIGLGTRLAHDRFPVFLGFMAMSAGTITLYSISWQSLFPEVIPIEKRNKTLTLRTFGIMFVGIVSPLASGLILSSISSNEGKIAAHQAFFIFSAFLAGLQMLALGKIKPTHVEEPRGMSFSALREAGASLFRNKRFVFFSIVAVFFYITWQLDWTLYYIGQTQYLFFNELMLGFATVTAALAQFFTLRFWSKVNERKGVVLPVLFGILGLACCPLAMIASTSLPKPFNQPVFIILNAAANLAITPIGLNIFQCLLQVLDGKNKTLSISIFTLFTALSNAVMPMLGVLLYKALGSDLSSLRLTFLIVFLLRILAALLWLYRWRKIKDDPLPLGVLRH